MEFLEFFFHSQPQVELQHLKKTGKIYYQCCYGMLALPHSFHPGKGKIILCLWAEFRVQALNSYLLVLNHDLYPMIFVGTHTLLVVA